MNVWRKTGIQNLLRNAQSGRYYARFTIAGKLKWVSLKTDKKTVATIRLNDERTKQDKMRLALDNVGTGTATMGELKAIWEQEQSNNTELREATRNLRKRQMCGIVRTWPAFDKLAPERITRTAAEEWRNRVLSVGTGFVNPFATTTKNRVKGLAPSTVNKMLDILRLMLDIAVKRGQLPVNPLAAKGLKLRVTPKKPELPEAAVLARIYAKIESHNGSNSPHSADFCRLLNFTGMRVSEAAALCWKHVDFTRGIIKVPGTKTEAAVREVPMMQDSRALLMKLREQAEAGSTKKENGVPFVNPDCAVSTVSEAGVSLRNACKRLRITPALTHHDLRDAFTTSCIEAGVDIPTVAGWLGHVDGGALLMRTYTHHRRKHSQAQAAKVSFGGAQ